MMASEEEIEAATKAIEDAYGDVLDIQSEPIAKAALEAAERVRWQAIETAPKDGDLILCASSPEEVRMSTGRWAEGYWLWGHEEEPTHWQPLPSPPESKSK
jgi:hypothetical protein